MPRNLDDNPLSVLLVEDSPTQVKAIKAAIEQSSALELFEVVEDGQQALDVLAGDASDGVAVRPELVLLDLNLPKLDGLEVLRKMKADSDWRTIPVVLLMGESDSETVSEAYALGVSTCIEKPITFEEYASLLSAIGNYWALAARA